MRYSNCNDDAQENFQIAFIKVFRELKKFNHKGSFHRWVRQIMINQCIDSIRRKKRDKWVEIDDNFDFGEDTESEDFLMGFSSQQILESIQKLPSQYRLVFNMYVLEEYSHKEISAELGISESTSKSNLHRAKSKLKMELMKLKNQ